MQMLAVLGLMVGAKVVHNIVSAYHTASAVGGGSIGRERITAIDGSKYLVLKTENSKEAADALARLAQNIGKVVEHLKSKKEAYSRYKAAIDTMLQRLAVTGINFVELDYSSNDAIAINQNKNEEIAICLRRNPPNDTTVADDQVLLYIALHEIAHSMTTAYAASFQNHTVHSREFRENENFLMSIASTLNLLRPATIPGMVHCRFSMPDPANAL